MLSIVLVGNRATRLVGAKMVTPRGYFAKYGEAPRRRDQPRNPG
jgi:precorrin-3B methylase